MSDCEYQAQDLCMFCGGRFGNTMPGKPDGSALHNTKGKLLREVGW